MTLPTECGVDGARWIKRDVRVGERLEPTRAGRTLVSIALDADPPVDWLRALTAGGDAVYELRAAGDTAPEAFVARAKAVRSAVPKAVLCGPGLPLDAAKPLLTAGLLDHLDAFSLAQDAPPSEAVAGELERARVAVVLNAPRMRRRLPILVTSCAAARDRQSALRLILCHLAAGVPVTILPDPALAPGGSFAGMILRHRMGSDLLLQRGDTDTLILARLDGTTRAAGPALRRLASIRFSPGPLVTLAGPPDWPTSDVSGGQWTIRNYEKKPATIELSVKLPGQEARRSVSVRPGQTVEGRLVSAGPLERDDTPRIVSVSLTWNGRPLGAPIQLSLLRADPLRLSRLDGGQLQIDDLAGRGLDAVLVDRNGRRRVFLDRGVRQLTVPAASGPVRLVNRADGLLAHLDP